MIDTAPKEKKVVRIAAIAGLLGGLIAYLVLDFGLAAAIFVALLLALLVALVLWQMWRERTAADAAPPPAVAAAKPVPAPAPTPAPAPAPVATEEAAAPVEQAAVAVPAATDNGAAQAEVAEDAAAPEKPQMLAAPRAGGADDLKQIKGVGPKLESLLHEMGIYHFDQIAGWSAAEVAWVDANIKGFKGRVSRDTWVEQAKILAAGGATAFSDKVKQGDVY